MRTGKISETVLKRSVLRQIEGYGEEVKKGAGVGEDCAFLAWEASDGEKQGTLTAVSTETVTLPVPNAAYLAVMAGANNLAAAGAVPVAVTIALTLPEAADEALLKEQMRQAQQCCRELGIQIAGGHSEVSGWVKAPVVTATVIGRAPAMGQGPEGMPRRPEDLEIVASKWIGLEGTFLIAQEKEQELKRRYPAALVLRAKGQGQYLSVAPEAAIALKSGVYAMHDVRCGGIFGALWELSQKAGAGLCVDLKKIPVRQETIEVCEFYNLNPYGLLSGGMLLMATKEGGKLAGLLEAAGIPAAVIGSMNSSHDKTVANKEEVRYLGPAEPDEIYKLFIAK